MVISSPFWILFFLQRARDEAPLVPLLSSGYYTNPHSRDMAMERWLVLNIQIPEGP